MLTWIRASLTRQVAAVAVALVLVLGVVFALLLAAIDTQRDSAEEARAAEDAIVAAVDVEGRVLDLERAARGFVITGDGTFLRPHGAAIAAYPRALERLAASVSEGRSRAQADRIAAQLRAYAAEYSVPLVATARRSLSEARALVARGEGQRRVERIVDELQAVRDRETDAIQAHREDADASANRAVAFAVVGLLVSALLVAGFVFYLRRSVVAPARELTVTADRLALGELAARSAEPPGYNELGQLSRAFNEMAQSLEVASQTAREAEAARDDFFALVSHELRTPLTSIVGYVELLLEDAEGLAKLGEDERRRFLAVVNRNARRLLRLVGDLLFVARLEAGRLEFESIPFDLAEPLQEAVEAAQPRADHAGVELRWKLADAVNVHGDPGRIGQAIDNLVSNALKYTPEGGRVVVSMRREGADAVIEVSDTGVGISPEEQTRLFEPFFRARTTTQAEGVGLGLVITRAVVEGHNGTVEFESEPGSGSTFRIHLPEIVAE